ncbi:MAG TPA: 3D domain-containing protein [Longimicrobium sp.]|jgi:3D (Asp-Asp-Asp) domain-containing protein
MSPFSQRAPISRTFTAVAAGLVLAAVLGVWACAPRAVASPVVPAPTNYLPAAVAPPAPAEPSPELLRSIEARIRAQVEAEHRAEHAAAPARSAAGAFEVRERMEMSSTAYCLKGLMRTGVRTRDGMAAADPRVIPLGSVVRVSHPDGRPIGVFVVMDTGGAVRGNKIDIYMDSCREATDWGRRAVVAEVLAIGRS